MRLDLFGNHAAPNVEHAAAIKRWVAQSFGLTAETSVMVTELRCSEPGCPPLETVIAVLDTPGRPRQYKLHKPLATVTEDDVAGLAAVTGERTGE